MCCFVLYNTLMSIWTRISEALKALASGEGLSSLFETFRTPPERSIGFTIAIIALGAKMAKADGVVTRDEVIAFRQIFQLHAQDEAAAAKVFDLARQDVAGFESYASKIAKMFKDDSEMLIDLLEGLIHIAMADGEYHPKEDEFLQRVAEILALSGAPSCACAPAMCPAWCQTRTRCLVSLHPIALKLFAPVIASSSRNPTPMR